MYSPIKEDYEAWIFEGERRGLNMGALLVSDSSLWELYCDYSKEKEKALKPYGDRGFIFYPSYLGTYETLKEVDPALSIEFLETLIGYGVKDELPPDITPLIKALLLGPMKTIDKAWINYLRKSAHNSKKDDSGDR